MKIIKNNYQYRRLLENQHSALYIFYFCEHCLYGKYNQTIFSFGVMKERAYYSWFIVMCLE